MERCVYNSYAGYFSNFCNASNNFYVEDQVERLESNLNILIDGKIIIAPML